MYEIMSRLYVQMFEIAFQVKLSYPSCKCTCQVQVKIPIGPKWGSDHRVESQMIEGICKFDQKIKNTLGQ
jgi:hypothetical protein